MGSCPYYKNVHDGKQFRPASVAVKRCEAKSKEQNDAHHHAVPCISGNKTYKNMNFPKYDMQVEINSKRKRRDIPSTQEHSFNSKETVESGDFTL